MATTLHLADIPSNQSTMSNSIQLRAFQAGKPGDAEAFRTLNEWWIKKYFGIEEHDTEILGDPEGYVPTLEFTIETGRLVRAKAKGKPKSFPPEEGIELPVLYRRDRPDTWCYLGNLADYESEATIGVGEMSLGTVVATGLLLGVIGLVAVLWP